MRRAILTCAVAVLILGGLVWALRLFEPERASEAAGEEPFWVAALATATDDDFRQPSADWRLSLPEDHGPHPDMRTESWAIAAHLKSAAGEDIGVQFSLLKVGVAPPKSAEAGNAETDSVWDIETLYRAHAILSGQSKDRAAGEERFGRAIPGLVGFDEIRRELRLDNWVLEFGGSGGEDQMTLSATVSDTAVLRLSLQPERSPLSSSEGNGGPVAGYGITRLAVEGTLDDGSGAQRLTGTAWFDHLWGELPLPGAGPISLDRLQLQLVDGTDISLLRSRRSDGTGTPILDGFAVLPDSTLSVFDDSDISMTPSRFWQHPGTGTDYPVGWQLSGAGLNLMVEPVVDAQAFDFAVPMWSGLVRVSGTRDGAPVSGLGTMQLTGYSEP